MERKSYYKTPSIRYVALATLSKICLIGSTIDGYDSDNGGWSTHPGESNDGYVEDPGYWN